MGLNMTLGAQQIYPPLPTMAELIAKEVAKQDEITEVTILAGFKRIVDGKEYTFSYKTDDQSNFNMGIAGASLSMQLGSMSEDQLAVSYPGYRDSSGGLHPEKLPVALPQDYIVAWRGHADGTSYTLTLTPQAFLDLAAGAAEHKQVTLAQGWAIKAQLEACKTEMELQLKVKELDLDRKLSDARDLKKKNNLQ